MQNAEIVKIILEVYCEREVDRILRGFAAYCGPRYLFEDFRPRFSPNKATSHRDL